MGSDFDLLVFVFRRYIFFGLLYSHDILEGGGKAWEHWATSDPRLARRATRAWTESQPFYCTAVFFTCLAVSLTGSGWGLSRRPAASRPRKNTAAARIRTTGAYLFGENIWTYQIILIYFLLSSCDASKRRLKTSLSESEFWKRKI